MAPEGWPEAVANLTQQTGNRATREKPKQNYNKNLFSLIFIQIFA